MFHYKKLFAILFTTLFLFASNTHAQETSAETLPKSSRFSTVALEYISWQELLTIDSGTQKDNAYGDFFGNALTYEREIYNSIRSGVAFSGSFLFGKANAGGTQTILTYQSAQQSWMGAMGSARFAYRMTPTITASIGPMALYRSLKWADQGTGYSLKSGSTVNIGILGELGVKLVPRWEVRMEMGTLAIRAATFWSIGLGYKF